jgi:hypothetical protein
MNRRRFLEGSGFGLGALLAASSAGKGARAGLFHPPRTDQGRVHRDRAARRHGGPEATIASAKRRCRDVQRSVGVGSYRIDLHPSTGGINYIDISSLPFQIPLGALIPRRIENLLPAYKNLGTTHITNGCFRLHPVEWAIGEAAGALVAFCMESRLSPRSVRNTSKRLATFQSRLTAQGVEIAWPKVSPR